MTGPMCITTDLEFERWIETFRGERFTGVFLNWLSHKCHILQMNGESCRFKERLRRRKVIA